MNATIIVSCARFNNSSADQRIDQITSALRATGRPFSWWIGPCDRPADLDAVSHPITPPELSVIRVTAIKQLNDYASIMAAN